MSSAPLTPAATRRVRARRGDGSLLREEILAAAEEILIRTNDQASLSIRAVAAAVGVTPPSIYLHFADRNDLLFEVCERHMEHMEQAMQDAAEGEPDPLERLRRRGWAYLQWALDNPEHYRVLMMSRPDRTPDRFVDERLVDTAGLMPVVADLAEAIDAGLIRPDDPLETTKVLWMLIHGVASMLISKPEFPFPPADEVYARVFSLVRAGFTR
ncbi:MAG: TetR/AcrR family transcriptional regulator [Acidimicrobiaceae bacterium]|nr:TetR/AcrR family transcriptional regulator [Acidimicrobiaceae bacterium]